MGFFRNQRVRLTHSYRGFRRGELFRVADWLQDEPWVRVTRRGRSMWVPATLLENVEPIGGRRVEFTGRIGGPRRRSSYSTWMRFLATPEQIRVFPGSPHQ